LTGENLRPFFRGDRLSLRPAAAQQGVAKTPVNLHFLITRPEAERIPRPFILAPTDFDQRLTFGDRISYPFDHLSLFRQIAALRDNASCTHCPGWDWLESIDHLSAFDDRAGTLLLGARSHQSHIQEHGFITIQRFEERVNKVLLPYCAEKRERTNYTDWGLVILDGCTCHSLA
jgi:hypothetical protein